MSETTVWMHQVYIKASAQTVWDALTSTEWNARYGYQCQGEYDLRPGGAYRVLANAAMAEHGAPEVIIDGKVIESDPPRKLVQTWHAMFSDELTAEPPTTLTWELTEQNGQTKLTVTHELAGAPLSAEQISGQNPEAGGGWPFVLSDLKTLLETGKSLAE